MAKQKSLFHSFMDQYRLRQKNAVERSAEVQQSVQDTLAAMKGTSLETAKYILWALGCFAAAALALEILLRLFIHSPEPLAWEKLLEMDPAITLHPKRIWTAPYKSDSIYSSPEKKGNSRLKILFLGDPFASQGIPESQHSVPAELAGMLRSKGVDLIAYDIRVAGYGPQQEYALAMDSALAKTAPDLIVWSFDFHDYDAMMNRPLFWVANNSLKYLPSFCQPLYLQGIFYNTFVRTFPKSRVVRSMARLIGDLKLNSFLVSKSDYEISLLINQMVDDFTKRGIPVLLVKAPDGWIINHIEESRNWHFFSELGRLLPHYMDANEEIYGAAVAAKDAGRLGEIFSSGDTLSDKGKFHYAEALYSYLLKRGLLPKT